MSLSSIINRVSYAGNGSTTEFAYSYYFLASGDLVVLLVNDTTGVVTTQVITTNYTVSGAGVEAGGAVTMNVAPASGETLVIYRDAALTQGVDLRENDSLPAETVEEALDRQMMVSQRTRELTERSLRLSDGFTGSFSLELPSDIDTANSTIITNPSGNGFIVGPTADEISGAQASATAAASSASAASASASAAQTAETNAETAETNAEAAQTAAEVAQTASETAETNAETAQAAAESARDAILNTDKLVFTENASNPTGNPGAGDRWLFPKADGWYDEMDDGTVTKLFDTSGLGDVETVVSKTSAYTILATDSVILADSNSAAFTLTLPTAVGITGKTYTIKKTDSSANKVTIDGNGSEEIDGQTTIELLAENDFIRVVSDGTGWKITGRRIADKTQVRFLASDFTTNAATITGLSFANLEIGKWYEIKTQLRVTGTAADSIALLITHNSATIGRNSGRLDSSGAVDIQTDVTKFKATATTLTFVTNSLSATSTVEGDGSADETWARLTEINPLVETTGFTP